MNPNSRGPSIRKAPLPPSSSPGSAADATGKEQYPTLSTSARCRLTAACLVFLSAWFAWTVSSSADAFSPLGTLHQPTFSVQQQQDILARCAAINTLPGPPSNFLGRDKSDRFEQGTNATLIRNAWIWTGEKNGTVAFKGDVLLDQGIIKAIGDIPARTIEDTKNLTTVDAEGRWVTPGLVDMHSHIGIVSSPVLGGAVDVDSTKGPILPYLRSVDGLNTHDAGYQLAMAGGVTTVQVLPGSDNAIGGQSFFAKLRPTSDRSAVSMIVDPPYSLTGESPGWRSPTRWRHMKQACGENLRRYGTRLDTMWTLRYAYAQAAKVKAAQDLYCERAGAGLWDMLEYAFPEDLQWEMLVDVLRGKVKISNHCYEAVDLDALVRLSNEFKFHIASFHHAAEAWLVPDVLKQMWGGIPTVALFATTYRFKREAYRGSEFAPRVLADEGIPVVLKSDHPLLNSRYLAYEAQQAHYFGLPPHLALAAITSTPATTAGLSHRIGILQKGADADVVLWDSHPLNIGATPMKVWIDGILQIPVPAKDGVDTPVEVGKGKEGDRWRRAPSVPNWDKEREEALRWEGLPPLHGRSSKPDQVVFTNVKSVWTRTKDGKVEQRLGVGSAASDAGSLGSVVVVKGRIHCIGLSCSADDLAGYETVDLQGGSISPGLMTYGSPLGLGEILMEPSTTDGELPNALNANVPKIMDDVGGIVRAVDTLVFQTRDALTAYRSGVTFATSSLAKPIDMNGPGSRFLSGLSVAFRTGSSHAMERGAIVQDVGALHVVLGRSSPIIPGGPSVSTQMAALRRLLHGWESTDKETGYWFRKAAEGVVPLVIEVDSADIMASLLILKADVEDRIGSRMRMVFSGAAEAHLLAREISKFEVGVILNPARPYPMVWDQRRILPGPPLTNDTALVTLLDAGVIVGLGVRSSCEARHARFDANWASLESNGRIRQDQAYALVTTDLENLLGIRNIDEETADLVATQGGSMYLSISQYIFPRGRVRQRREEQHCW